MDSFHTLLTLFQQHEKFALSTHVNPDGDAIGSELALSIFITKLGKTVRLFNTDPVPKKYHFLPYWENIENAQASVNFRPDVVVILDASSRERIGPFLNNRLVAEHAVVNIDHHITAEAFGDYNIVLPNVSSTCEIIYNFIKTTNIAIDEETAICLYTGLMFDTGCFRYSNATPETHRIAANLIEIGNFAPDEVYSKVFEHIPLGKIHLLNLTLSTLKLTGDGKIATVFITQSMLDETKTTLDDVEGFVNQIQAIESVDVAICVCELPNGNSKVSLRSQGRVDVAALASEFNGGGHERASGCRINHPYNDSIRMLIESAKNYIKN